LGGGKLQSGGGRGKSPKKFSKSERGGGGLPVGAFFLQCYSLFLISPFRWLCVLREKEIERGRDGKPKLSSGCLGGGAFAGGGGVGAGTEVFSKFQENRKKKKKIAGQSGKRKGGLI